MSANLDQLNEGIQTDVASFQPQSRSEIHAWFSGMSDMFRSFGQAYATAADNLSNEHIHKSVIDALHELSSVVAGIGDHAEQLYATHVAAHDVWLKD